MDEGAERARPKDSRLARRNAPAVGMIRSRLTAFTKGFAFRVGKRQNSPAMLVFAEF